MTAMRQVVPRLRNIQRQVHGYQGTPFITGPNNGRFYSALASQAATPQSRQVIADAEFDHNIETELAKLPAKKAQEARRRLRNERRAEINGQSMGRKDSVIIPYIPSYEGPNPNSSRGLWTHLKIGFRKNKIREAWGQWLGQRQSKQNVDAVLSPANPYWLKDFVDQAHVSINLAHQIITTGAFDDPQVTKSLHPAMIEFLQTKREKLLNSYSPSHSITWMKHAPKNEKDAKKSSTQNELEIVTMRAAPFDQGGTVVQIAVRFRSLQSLEIRDERGLLVFGSHSKPQTIMEYFVFQKRLGLGNQEFLLLEQVEEDIKPDCLPV